MYVWMFGRVCNFSMINVDDSFEIFLIIYILVLNKNEYIM